MDSDAVSSTILCLFLCMSNCADAIETFHVYVGIVHAHECGHTVFPESSVQLQVRITFGISSMHC